MKLSEIASALDATLENADPETEITGVAGIEEAGAGQITFVANPKYAAAAQELRPPRRLSSPRTSPQSRPACCAARTRISLLRGRSICFTRLRRYRAGVHPTAVIAPTAKIGANAHVAAYVVIDDDVEIGDDAVLAAACGYLSRSARSATIFCPRPRRSPRVLPAGRRCHPAERSHRRQRRFWLCPRRSTGTTAGRKSRNPDRRCWRTTSKCRRTRASIAPASARPASRAAPRSTTWCRSDMARPSARTLCCARKWGWPDRPSSARTSFLPAKWAWPGTATIGDGVVVTAQSGTHGDIPPGTDGERLAGF